MKPVPYQQYEKIVFTNKVWLLYPQQGEPLTYEKIRIIVSVGLFFVLELSNNGYSKRFVIFSDQITNEVYRYLKINEKYVQN